MRTDRSVRWAKSMLVCTVTPEPSPAADGLLVRSRAGAIAPAANGLLAHGQRWGRSLAADGLLAHRVEGAQNPEQADHRPPTGCSKRDSSNMRSSASMLASVWPTAPGSEPSQRSAVMGPCRILLTIARLSSSIALSCFLVRPSPALASALSSSPARMLSAFPLSACGSAHFQRSLQHWIMGTLLSQCLTTKVKLAFPLLTTHWHPHLCVEMAYSTLICPPRHALIHARRRRTTSLTASYQPAW